MVTYFPKKFCFFIKKWAGVIFPKTHSLEIQLFKKNQVMSGEFRISQVELGEARRGEVRLGEVR
jgi:hypothetical protein